MITLYYGTDAWRLRHATASCEADLRIDGSTSGGTAELEHLLKYPGFFGQTTTVVVTEPLAFAGLVDLLKNTGARALKDVHVLLSQKCAPKETADRKKLLAQMERLASVSTEFTALKGAQLSAWIRSYCTGNGRAIDTDALEELVARIGSDTWMLANELEKLCAYAPERISRPAVTALVPLPQQQDEWELSNAIAAHDKRGAIAALHRRIAAGAPEPLLIGNVASAVRSLLMVRDLLDRGRPNAAIAAATGLHPYVVMKTVRGARMFKPDSLLAAHRNLATLDRAMKDGRADGIDGLFSVLITL